MKNSKIKIIVEDYENIEEIIFFSVLFVIAAVTLNLFVRSMLMRIEKLFFFLLAFASGGNSDSTSTNENDGSDEKVKRVGCRCRVGVVIGLRPTKLGKEEINN